jgi:hypothetical protein
MVYSGAQVLTTKELKVGDVLHCGRTGGRCMPWHVIDKEPAAAFIRVGTGSIVRMTGTDIRNGTPMFRATECPICSKSTMPGNIVPSLHHVQTYTVQTLDSADVPSSLSGVDNVRKKSQRYSGGAILDTPTRRRTELTKQMVKKIVGNL